MPTFTAKRKRRSRNKTMRRSRKITTVSLQRQVNTIRRDLSKLPERKQITVPWTTSVGGTPLIYHMDQVSAGDGESDRSGLEITPTGLQFYLRFTGENPLTSGDSNVVRVIVFRWFDDVYPTATDILYDNTAGIFTGYPYVDIPTVWDEKPKYQVLCDKRISIDENSYDNVFFGHKMSFKKNAKIVYKGPASTDISTKNIFYLVVSDSTVVPHPVFTGYSRITFKDA